MSVLVDIVLEIYEILFEWTRRGSKRSGTRSRLRLVALVTGLLVVTAGGLVAALESPVAGAVLVLAGFALVLLAI